MEGTQAAGNRKIYLVNGNYYDTARKGLIRYDLGANATATPGDTGTQIIGPTYLAHLLSLRRGPRQLTATGT